MNSVPFVAYDRDADVLYLSTRREAAARGIEDEHGILWRYDRAGELIGATVADFRECWSGRRPLLVEELSRRFKIAAPQMRDILEHALESRPSKAVPSV